ncbi:MAG: carbon-nitrogen hydrolase family protein [Anaerolineales bacterium]|nr:carbon-nitrogen hydrolase family protein [Anaerolineales bacterium]
MPIFAAVQYRPELLKPQKNLETMINLIEQVSSRGADVVVFPECAVTGYALTPEEAAELAEPIPGEQTKALATACRQAGLAVVVVGTLEKDENGRLFNTAVLVGPEGLIGRYRKTHLPYLGVDRYLEAGDALPDPFETVVGRLGILICYDLRFPEPTRVLALAGAQVVLLPTAWPQAATLYPDFIAQARAAENGVYLVAANRIGEERGTGYLGRSIIADPNGEKLAEAGIDTEEILCVEIDPAQSDRKDRIFRVGEYELRPFADRRPDLYGTIASQGTLLSS